MQSIMQEQPVRHASTDISCASSTIPVGHAPNDDAHTPVSADQSTADESTAVCLDRDGEPRGYITARELQVIRQQLAKRASLERASKGAPA